MKENLLDRIKLPKPGQYDFAKRCELADKAFSIYNGNKSIGGNRVKRGDDLIEIILEDSEYNTTCLMTLDTFTHTFLAGNENWKKAAIIKLTEAPIKDSGRAFRNYYISTETYENMYIKDNDEWKNNIIDLFDYHGDAKEKLDSVVNMEEYER